MISSQIQPEVATRSCTRRVGRAIFSDNAHFKNADKAEPSAIAIRRRATVPEGLSFPDDQRASMLELDGAEHARVRTPLVQALYGRIAACPALAASDASTFA